MDNSSQAAWLNKDGGDKLPEKIRTTVLFQRLGPYHHARLKAAGLRLHVTAVEFSNVDSTYAWDLVEGADGFDRVTLFSGTSDKDLRAGRIFNRVSEVLDQLRPQAVAIPGWSERCSLSALRWCKIRGVPAVMMSETTAWDDERRWWKEMLKRRVVNLCSAGLVGGRAHAKYLEQLGMDRKKIFPGYDVVDNEHFTIGAAKARGNEQAVREKLGLPGKYFLASARFVGKKNLSRLIEAYAQYRAMALKPEVWDLVILGDGPLREVLDSQLSTLNLRDHALLPGFKQYDELPAYYGLASAFIHASVIEQWGLVINEAMASGLPVLVSNRCGCAKDLVSEGRNGFAFDPCNVEQLAKLMAKISDSTFPLSELGAVSRQMIEPLGASVFGEGLERAVAEALRGSQPDASRVDHFLLRMLMSR